jgi:hypothetical protein
MDGGFSEALAEIIARGSKLDQAVGASGWHIVRDVERRQGDGFRLESGKRAIDIGIAPMAANERAFLKHQGLGLTYSVPHDREDPTVDPKVLPFVEQIGKYVLKLLARDRRTAQGRATDMQALREFATTAVEELESAYAPELDREPLHDMAHLGRRHGDKFSKVAAA